MLVAATVVAGCGGGSAIGDELVCLPAGPPAIGALVARASDPPIAIVYGANPQVLRYEPDIEFWRPIVVPAGRWAIAQDGNYYVLSGTGFHRSLDGLTFEEIGPGGGDAYGGYNVLLGQTTDGSHWWLSNGGVQQLRPGAAEWTQAFATELPGPAPERGAMVADGSIWLFGDAGMGGGIIDGLFHISADGSTVKKVYDCNSPEILYCAQTVRLVTTNARGDFFFHLSNDLRLNHRFYKVAAGTETVVELGDLSMTKSEKLPNSALGGLSMAALGDQLYITTRDEYSGGTGYVMVFDQGDPNPRIVVETLDRNSKVVASSDGSHLYVHSPSVCEIR